MTSLRRLGTLLPACLALGACGQTNRAAIGRSVTNDAPSGSVSGDVFRGSSISADGAAVDPYRGPFRILVLSKTLGYHHDSIPAGQQMLRDLGGCVDDASCALTNDVPIAGAKPN